MIGPCFGTNSPTSGVGTQSAGIVLAQLANSAALNPTYITVGSESPLRQPVFA